MKTATINVKTEPELKRRAQAFAKSTGMSLSDVVNLSLRQTVNRGDLVVSEAFNPSEYLKKAIGEARNQKHKGAYKSFKNPQEAVNFIRNLK